jgi:hypothetical protein
MKQNMKDKPELIFLILFLLILAESCGLSKYSTIERPEFIGKQLSGFPDTSVGLVTIDTVAVHLIRPEYMPC